MEEDPVLAALHKLKRQNEEISQQKERINDLKSIKKIKKAQELNETLERYKDLEAEIR